MTIEQARELLRLVKSGIKVSPYRVRVALETLIELQEKNTSTGSRPEYPDAPLMTVNWDRDEVPEGFVDLTFRVPEHGRGFHGKMTADLTIKENR